jgi:methyltransferase-like protein/2-polyprenyl-3-methyl-5-hydroxy-6-metoxy-1,4-benzoquinol methylase
MNSMDTASDAPLTDYDKVLYPGHTRIQTHPDRLATIATLFGLRPAPVERCRVLELGCGNGSNLGPIAFSLPESRCVGVDAAGIPIAQAQTMAKELGMTGVRFLQADIRDLGDLGGPFDYIIAHGVYSWVPTEVRDKLLEACRTNLAPQGVAFVSYNAYPGNHLSRMIREMLLYHVGVLEDPAEKVHQALSLARFLAESREEPDLYGQLLKEELDRLMHTSPNYVFHDVLAPINEPSYFSEFIAHAGRHHLQYLGEADFHEMLDRRFKPEVSSTLSRLSGDRIQREQYLDFVKCRRFRQTLLCHEDQRLDLALRPEQAAGFYVACMARPVSPQPDLHGPAAEKFEGAKGASLTTDSPLAKNALHMLSELWPEPLHFGELLARVRARIQGHGTREAAVVQQDEVELGKTVLQAYAVGLVELHTYLPSYARKAGERPSASPLARWQARHGSFVTSIYHTSMSVEDALARELVLLLDGSRDRTALLESLLSMARKHAAGSPESGDSEDPGQSRILLAAELERNLAKLARMGLLVD